MDAVTYPDAGVISFVNDRMIPLRIAADDRLAGQFKVKWTPTLVTLDENGEETSQIRGVPKTGRICRCVFIGYRKGRFRDRRL